jgi:long-subunit fatty acid transport protein
MKRIMTTAAVVALSAGMAHAGGVERSTQSTGILFEKGNYAEFNIGGFNPDVSGTVAGGAIASGDMAPGYGTYSLGYKQALSDKIDVAIVLDQPLGAKVSYPLANMPYPFAGSSATIDSTAITALMRYKLPNNFSAIGGLRIQRASGKADLNVYSTLAGAYLPYSLRTSTETDLGYVIGVAWEKPEIAARVALTYNSKITHDFTATETFMGGPAPGTGNTFETVSPESVNLEFQTGIAKDTLLMGSVRWVHWTQFEIAPDGYRATIGGGDPGAAGALVAYSNNTTSWNIGVGRKFNEQWSGAVMFGYEKHQGGTTGNLGPTDGYKSVSLAASYKASDNVKITGGVRYVKIGDATTNPPTLADFSGNSGWGAGVRVGISF